MKVQIEAESTFQKTTEVSSTAEFGNLLQSLHANYRQVDYYLQVGEIEKTQGWILHLSAILSQVDDLLQIVVPFLVSAEVPFKIIANLAIAEDLLAGNFGFTQIGKVVSVYPEGDRAALDIAKKLVALTMPFKGPFVPTDICLGHVVYTRYGSFNPVIQRNSKGVEEKFIYDALGQLIQDSYAVPFLYPTGIPWPFHQLADPVLPTPPTLFNRIYKVIDVLKADPRGNVFQGLYLKSLFKVKKCVLKQGFANADSDRVGRDIQDRLAWQAKLYIDLSNTIPMPAVYDYIQENAYSLLVMEYIDGDSLFQKAQDLNPHCDAWPDLNPEVAITMTTYGIEIAKIISRMHQKGYIHRDIMPVNFMIDKKNRIFLIDLELTYCLLQEKPDPPFTLGTPGFASPEQMQTLRPAANQDIYSLGAVLLWLFTGLSPTKYTTECMDELPNNIDFFIENRELALMLTSCLSKEPKSRPIVANIIDKLEKYRESLQKSRTQQTELKIGRLTNKKTSNINELIYAALDGLNKAPVISFNDYWFSKKIIAETLTGLKNKEYVRYPGIAHGISGPIYVLARLKKSGVDLGTCLSRFYRAWQYIEHTYFTNLTALPAGLYYGAAGLAVAAAEAVDSDLLNKNRSYYSETVKSCLSMPNSLHDLASGIAGQGVATLRCKSLLTKDQTNQILTNIISQLINSQRKDGSWQETSSFDIEQGDIGIIWFLLESLSTYSDIAVQTAAEKAISGFVHSKARMARFRHQVALLSSCNTLSEGSSTLLLLLKAYEVLQDRTCRRLAEDALLQYPDRIVHWNFTQSNGLAGLGELYLEAWRVLGHEKWKDRANWVAESFSHTFCRNPDGSGYWMLEEYNPPTADLMGGISGIIHFLARFKNPNKIGLRILN